MRRILGCPDLQGLPVILEVPGMEGNGPDPENMAARPAAAPQEGLGARAGCASPHAGVAQR